eukprot:CAMPEP_0174871726 /NCGR_PEP_ID=MMETSP1114-20130205/72019_1 /TAXON_ID=312471 /ORGANISM="Neobodo designis, Strain CCAP 1951/1" /LENGTH=259 /DNA_ID=CAMNT_0016107015 /DNA_START=45 /DNA_END=820 /DNA_ORIENTATION=+
MSLGALAPVISGAFGLSQNESGHDIQSGRSAAPLSRPASRNAHMRPRVAPIVASPPPGSYNGPLTVRLQCSTAGVEMRFTRDGTNPYPNSDRDHGYRCERYSASGIMLAGKGRHILTVVATSPGCVEGRPVQLTYKLLSGEEPKKPRAEAIREAAMNRQFELAASHEASMPFERARTPGYAGETPALALADTTNSRTLEKLKSGGRRVELFKLATQPGGKVGYKRVVPPSLAVDLPPNPLASRPPSATPSLTSDPRGPP